MVYITPALPGHCVYFPFEIFLGSLCSPEGTESVPPYILGLLLHKASVIFLHLFPARDR